MSVLDQTLSTISDFGIACKHADEMLFTESVRGRPYQAVVVVSGVSGAGRVTTLDADDEGASLMFDA